ncbi:hypothetical protein IAD21_06346 [Abditibacteriota bacterium]|nr:hypothetical protein IAD21_06346 [Abditibacteriota bacterium]
MITRLYQLAFSLALASMVGVPSDANAQSMNATAPNVTSPMIPASFDVFDFSNPDMIVAMDANPDAQIAGKRLQIRTPANRGTTVTLRPSDSHWDFNIWTRLELEMANRGQEVVRLRVRADNDGASDWGHSALNTGFVAPGERKVFNLFLYRTGSVRDSHPELKVFAGMNGLPGGFMDHWHTIDASDVRSLHIEVYGASVPQKLDVFRVRAIHPIVPQILRDKGTAFFPFIDQFGQYRYADWPGKVENEAQLKRNARHEEADLRAHPGSPQWDKWGGWKNGLQLRASGHFRTEKVAGKWWLVDPDGHLFWSHGANSVGTESAGTRISGREAYFQLLPPREGATANLWSQSKPDAPTDFNFLEWNRLRQYGPEWKTTDRDLTHRRMRSWGLNTIGNWSNDAIQSQNRTPFTASLWPWSPTINGDTFWDVFHPDFEKNFDQGIASGVKEHGDNPWCIGYFIHNEMGWAGNALGTVSQIFASDSYSKRELVRLLRERTPDIADFNRKIGRNFADWDAVQANRENIDLIGVRADAEEFYTRYAEQYFQSCAQSMHKHAPNTLYLGARMNVSNPLSVRAAAKWCDVLSFNLYQDDIGGFRPADVDRPVIASEFHFGALDRGMFATGLRPASDEKDRAAKYRFYVEGALRNPYLVGTHWFAYCTQAPTGRGDGENYEDGFFDITGTPYPELQVVLREIGDSLYTIRNAP